MSQYDVTNFATDVLELSFKTPVLVDFWAEWCGPCRVLGPTLERLAGQANGRWVLKKLNTEQLPDISAQYGIRSIPNVKLFSNGNPIDEFVGALPEPAIVQWLEKAIPDPNMGLLDQAEALLRSEQRDAAAAMAQQVLSGAPDNERARSIAATALMFKDPTRALELVKDLDEGSKHWELAGSVKELGALLEKRTKGTSLEDKPVRAVYLQAIDAVAQQNFDLALQKFIEVIREDRYYDDDGSRKACIAIFKYLGEEHDITQKHRREFGSALYV